MEKAKDPLHGRGSTANPPNRFAPRHVDRDEDLEPDDASPATQVIKDATRSILTRFDSPDLGSGTHLNPYRGCEHGCPYCYARPYHEYLGYSAGLDFETKIVVKENAPALLREEFDSPTWEPQTVSMSGVTDCYQPLERRLEITRGCLAVFAEYRNPVAIITKNHLVTRDVDHLAELSKHGAAAVVLSITTLDPALSRVMEPRASVPARRLAAIAKLAAAGVNVGVNVAPIIPGLTDHEIPAILDAAWSAGARSAGHTVVRLPYAVKDIFGAWLERHFPDRKDKVLNRLREMHGGKLNDPRFGTRMTGEGVFAEQIGSMFRVYRQRAGFGNGFQKLSAAAFRRPPGPQLTLFG